MGREGEPADDRNLEVTAEALSTSSSIGGVLAGLTFAALVVYIAFTQRTVLQDAVVISLGLTSILFILYSVHFSIALDRLAVGRDERPAVQIAERLGLMGFAGFFVSLGLIAFSLDLVLGLVFSVLATAIAILFGIRPGLKLAVWSRDF